MTDNKSLKSILISDSMRNVFANLISLPVSMVATLLMARILGPELTGITAAAIMLVLNYTVNAHLGALNALSQRYPYLVGLGSAESKQEAKRMQGVVLGVVSIGACGVVLVLLGLAFWQFLIGSRLMAMGFIFGSIVAVLQLYITYYVFVVRSTNQFAYYSRYTLMFSWIPLVWVIGARCGGIIGQWVALVATEFVMCLAIYRNIGRDIKLEFDFKTSWKYIKLGFPLYAVGALFVVFTTLDRLTTAIFLGTTALGLYGVASIATFLGFIPGVIGQIMWPRIAEKLGIVGQDWKGLLPFIERPTFLMAYLLPIMIGAVVLVIPPATELMLPRYVSGIEAGQIAAISAYFLGFMCMYTVFLGTSLRLLSYGVITFLGIGLNLISSYLSVHFGWGLAGIAWAKVISYGVVAVLLFWHVERLFDRPFKGIAWRLIILLTPMVLVYFLAFWIIPWLVPGHASSFPGKLWRLGCQEMIMVLVTSPLIWIALHRSGAMVDVSAIISRRLQPFLRKR
jgi:O-antigen/teichoic acid export membrane protein